MLEMDQSMSGYEGGRGHVQLRILDGCELSEAYDGEGICWG